MWKRKARIVLLTISLLVMISWGYAQKKMSAVISFSHDSGFYSNGFMLTITGSEAYTLHYTLDGSMPDEASPVYEGPIRIEDASMHENVYSVRTDISEGFFNEAGYVAPDAPVDKCNIVRAALFDSDGTCVSQASKVYFVGFDEKDGYSDMQVISIVTDPDNLFDYDYGIYVMGAVYDNSEDIEVWRNKKANYSMRGMEWEREAVIDVFDESRNLMESCKAGIRIHGGASRAHAQKSLNIYARTCYSGSDVFETDFFQNGKGPHKMILGTQGNDEKVKIKNYMVWKLAVEADCNCATMKMIPCVLFLNGEYWGVYYLSEAYGADYISTHYAVDKKDIVMLKNGALEEGVEEDYRLQYDMTAFISNNDMKIDDNYKQACELIDIESFIDYYALEIYVANQDWIPNNYAYWRSREINSKNQYYDGKWRWMLFDTDQAAVLTEFDDDTIQHAIEKDTVFASLMQNREVQEMFRDKINEISDVYEQNYNEWIDDWLAEMNTGISRNGERFWGENGIDDYFQWMITGMRAYPKERERYLNAYMDLHFNQ